MSYYSETYKLFRCTRCYGNSDNRDTVTKYFVIQNNNMNVLIEYIKNTTQEKEYTFCIQKFINNEIRWRRLVKHSRTSWHKWLKGDLTTTWEKYVWDEKQEKWRISNYRYDDEIVK